MKPRTLELTALVAVFLVVSLPGSKAMWGPFFGDYDDYDDPYGDFDNTPATPTVNNDVQFGECGGDTLAETTEKLKNDNPELFEGYPTLFDLSTYVIGIKEGYISHTSFGASFVHKRGEGVLTFSNSGTDRTSPANVKVILKDLLVYQKGEESWSQRWGFGLKKELRFPLIELEFKLYLEAKGRYNRRATIDDPKGRLIFDLNDLGPNDLNNDITVRIGKVGTRLIGKDNGAVVGSLEKLATFFNGIVNSLLEPQIRQLIGNGAKCFLRTGQPTLFGLVHEGDFQRKELIEKLAKCNFAEGHLDEDCLRLVNVAPPTDDATTATRVAEEAERAQRKVLRRLEGINHSIGVYMYGSGKHQGGTAKDEIDTTVDYNAALRIDLPTGLLFTQMRNSSTNMYDALKTDISQDEDYRKVYMKAIVQNMLNDRTVSAADMSPILRYFERMALLPGSDMHVYVHGMDVKVVKEGLPEEDLGKSIDEIIESGPPSLNADIKSMKFVTENVKAGKAVAFPLEQILADGVLQQNDAYIIKLCMERYHDKDIDHKLIQDCIKKGREHNKGYLTLKDEELERYGESSEYTLVGHVYTAGNDLGFDGILDSEFFAELAKANCPVDGKLCPEFIAVMGEYFNAHPIVLRLSTPDADPRHGVSWDGSDEVVKRKRGISVDKDDFLVNLKVAFKGAMNLGVILAMYSNTDNFVQDQAKAVLQALAEDAAKGLLDGGGKVISSALEEVITDVPPAADPQWRRSYRDELDGFLDGFISDSDSASELSSSSSDESGDDDLESPTKDDSAKFYDALEHQLGEDK